MMEGGGVRVGARERALQGVGAEGSGSGKTRASRRSRRAARPGLRRGGGAWPRRRGSAPGGEIAEAALGFGWGGGGAARRDWGFGGEWAILIRRRGALACAPGWEGRRFPRRGSRLRLREGERRARQRGPGCQRLASTRGRRRLGPRWQGACAAEASGVSGGCVAGGWA